jgi:REP element-mobilizing transposase RayT
MAAYHCITSAMNDEFQKQHRRSIRLKHYDYAKEGMYFFTICTYKRQLLFGDVTNGEMKLNQFGRVVCDESHKSTAIRHELELDTFIVMPNHTHGIIALKDPNVVGATGRSPSSSGPTKHSLAAFIAGFKAAVTKRINRMRGTPEAPVWQRNYHEHVIRDEESLNRIRQYILNNPAQWDQDPENPEAKGDQPVAPTKDATNTHHGVSFENGR